MIERIELSNFQSHNDSTFEFHPGINVITGQSDSGKTAVVRALRWVAFNQPRGKGFISHWASESNVIISVDGERIERAVGKSDNYYRWVDGSLFKAFGSSVPEEIQKLLNLNDINLQLQLDAPFLLSESAGGVARHWNDVANLDVIDLATSNVNKMAKSLERNISELKERKDKIEDRLKAYEPLDDIEKELHLVEKLDNEIRDLYSDSADMDIVILNLNGVTDEIKHWQPYVQLDGLLNTCIQLESDISDKQAGIKDLESLVTGLKETREDIDYFKRITGLSGEVAELDGRRAAMRQLESLRNPLGYVVDDIAKEGWKIEELESLVSFEPEVKRLGKANEEIGFQNGEVLSLETAIRTLKRVHEQVGLAEHHLTILEKEFHESLPENGICPLCGGEMNV